MVEPLSCSSSTLTSSTQRYNLRSSAWLWFNCCLSSVFSVATTWNCSCCLLKLSESLCSTPSSWFTSSSSHWSFSTCFLLTSKLPSEAATASIWDLLNSSHLAWLSSNSFCIAVINSFFSWRLTFKAFIFSSCALTSLFSCVIVFSAATNCLFSEDKNALPLSSSSSAWLFTSVSVKKSVYFLLYYTHWYSTWEKHNIFKIFFMSHTVIKNMKGLAPIKETVVPVSGKWDLPIWYQTRIYT